MEPPSPSIFQTGGAKSKSKAKTSKKPAKSKSKSKAKPAKSKPAKSKAKATSGGTKTIKDRIKAGAKVHVGEGGGLYLVFDGQKHYIRC